MRISPYSRRLIPGDENLERHQQAFLLAGQSRSDGSTGIATLAHPPDTSTEQYLERLPAER